MTDTEKHAKYAKIAATERGNPIGEKAAAIQQALAEKIRAETGKAPPVCVGLRPANNSIQMRRT